VPRVAGPKGAQLRRLAQPGAVVIVDTPPVLAVPTAHLLADHVDQVLFVVGAGLTRPEEIRSALALLPAQDKVSFVLNRGLVPSLAVDYDGYYGYGAKARPA